MAPNLNKNYYEVPFIIQPEIPQQGVISISKKIKDILEKSNGKLLKAEHWGNRDLAYKIKRNSKGRYYMLLIEAGAGLPEALTNYLKLNETILRYAIYRVKTPNMEDSHPLKERKKAVAASQQPEDNTFDTIF